MKEIILEDCIFVMKNSGIVYSGLYEEYFSNKEMVEILDAQGISHSFKYCINDIVNNSNFWLSFKLQNPFSLKEKSFKIIEKYCIKYKNNEAFI